MAANRGRCHHPARDHRRYRCHQSAPPQPGAGGHAAATAIITAPPIATQCARVTTGRSHCIALLGKLNLPLHQRRLVGDGRWRQVRG